MCAHVCVDGGGGPDELSLALVGRLEQLRLALDVVQLMCVVVVHRARPSTSTTTIAASATTTCTATAAYTATSAACAGTRAASAAAFLVLLQGADQMRHVVAVGRQHGAHDPIDDLVVGEYPAAVDVHGLTRVLECDARALLHVVVGAGDELGELEDELVELVDARLLELDEAQAYGVETVGLVVRLVERGDLDALDHVAAAVALLRIGAQHLALASDAPLAQLEIVLARATTRRRLRQLGAQYGLVHPLDHDLRQQLLLVDQHGAVVLLEGGHHCFAIAFQLLHARFLLVYPLSKQDKTIQNISNKRDTLVLTGERVIQLVGLLIDAAVDDDAVLVAAGVDGQKVASVVCGRRHLVVVQLIVVH